MGLFGTWFFLIGCLVTDTKHFKGRCVIIYLVLRPSSQRLQVSADTSAPGSVDGLVWPPPFTLSHPPPCSEPMSLGEELCVSLGYTLQLGLRLVSWCRKVLCCAPVPLVSGRLMHTECSSEWGEEDRV